MGTSILPSADRRGIINRRIDEINLELARLANQINVVFINCSEHFMQEDELNYDLYKKGGQYIHLNDEGNKLIVDLIDHVVKKNGGSFKKLTQVFWRRWPTQKNK